MGLLDHFAFAVREHVTRRKKLSRKRVFALLSLHSIERLSRRPERGNPRAGKS